MSRGASVLWLCSVLAACGSDATPAPSAPSPASGGGPEALAPVWDRGVDLLAGVLVVGDRLVVSDGDAIVFHDLATGAETARAERTAAFRSWIDEPTDPVLFDLGAFVVASGRERVLARFDRDARAPRWTNEECARPFAAARLGDGVAVLCQDDLLVLDGASGATRERLPLATTSYLDVHALIEVDGGLVARSGSSLVGIADDGHERFRLPSEDTFGLVASDAGFLVASLAMGLVERDASTGEARRTIALVDTPAPDPSGHGLRAFASPLGAPVGRVLSDGELVLVESGGLVRAVSLAAGARVWAAPVADAALAPDAVLACAGPRVLALDRATGVERWSWSVGGCDLLAASGTQLLVRHFAAGGEVTGADRALIGVVAFERGSRPVPCEAVDLRGTVTLAGAPGAGLHVYVGQDWSRTGSGAVASWGSRAIESAGTHGPMGTAITDASGHYAVQVCDRGHVPVVVDHADVERASGQPEVEGWASFVHLDGRRVYTLDFALTAHGPTP